MSLAEKKCTPCEGHTKPMEASVIQSQLNELPNWRLAGGVAIVADWKFKNFKQAHAFVSKIAEIAEEEQHHPDLAYGWGYARVTLTTHAINGLSENDFIVAAKINELQEQ